VTGLLSEVLQKLPDFWIPGIQYFKALHCIFKEADFCLDPGFAGCIILKSWQNFEFLKVKNPVPVRSGAVILLLIIKNYKCC
jgi:hypothetical protein